MAQNIADLGVQVKVSGEAELNSLANNADKVSKKFSILDKVINGTGSLLSKIKSHFINLNSATLTASEGLDEFERGLLKNVSAYKQAKEAAREYNQELNKTADTSNKLKKAVSGDRGAAQANRFNTGNIAAQLQDIVVTSQMNMNPLTIALQQGTQLVYILQQTKNPLKDLIGGLKNLLSPLTLIVVALTGFLAKFIQTVDWIKVGKIYLNDLANVFDILAKNVNLLAGVSGVILAGFIGHLIKIAPILETLKKTFVAVKTAGVAAGKAIFNSWVMIPALVVGFIEVVGLFPKHAEVAVNAVIDLFVKMANEIIGLFTAISQGIGIIIGGGVAGILSGSLDEGIKVIKDTFKDTMETEYIKAEPIKGVAKDIIEGTADVVQGVNKTISNTLTGTAEGLRKTAEGLGKNDKNGEKLQKTIASLRKEYEDLAISYQNKISDMQFEKSTRGLTDEQKLVAQINHEYDQEIAKLERKVALKQIDVGEFAKEKTELDKAKKALIEESLEQDRYNESVKNFNAVMDYSSSLTKGFFSDLKKGLKDGESAWESFTNAVVNMLDKIQDKMMDLAIDTMFDSLKKNNASGGSNWLSGVINAGISWFSGSSNEPIDLRPASMKTQAFGGVWENGVQKFARGGVVTSPTLFPMHNGAGLMGEAGPEAVMPLRRTSDGSLGVKAEGVGGSNVVVNVINNSNAKARTEQRQTAQGMEIDVMIDEMVAEKMARPGTASNSALRAYNNQQLITR